MLNYIKLMIYCYFKYILYPRVRVRVQRWWWTFKYGGRIPRQVLIRDFEERSDWINRDLQETIRRIPESSYVKYKSQFYDLIERAQKLEDDVHKLKMGPLK